MAQALVSRLPLTKMGESGAIIVGLHVVTKSLVNRLPVHPEPPPPIPLGGGCPKDGAPLDSLNRSA